MVRRETGFRVLYGPVRARDIPAYLANGCEADERMRQVRFELRDRMTVSLLDLTEAAKKGIMVTIAVWLLSSFGPAGFQLGYGWNRSALVILSLWAGILSGTVLTAALLPWLPGRMFSAKGAVAGLIIVIGIVLYNNSYGHYPATLPQAASLVLLVAALSAYLAMNFTGASTFTSLSGVKKEIRCSVPAVIAAAVAAAGLQLLRLFRIL